MPQPKDKDWLNGYKDPYICCLQETHLKTGDTYGLKVKGRKKIFHANMSAHFNECSLCGRHCQEHFGYINSSGLHVSQVSSHC